MEDFRRERNSFSRLKIHLVCVTKYRRCVFDDAAIEWMRAHCTKVCATMEAQLLELGGEHDHVHLLIEYPPKLSVSVLVNALKGTSSRLLRRDRPEIAERYFEGVLWSPSYLVASAGDTPLEAIKRYVEAQRASSAP
jgi:putative transposase